MMDHTQRILDASRLAVANFEQWRTSDGDAGSSFMMIAAMQKLGDAIDEMDAQTVRPHVLSILEQDIAVHGELWKELEKK